MLPQHQTSLPSRPIPTEKINIELGVIVQRFHIVFHLGRYYSFHYWFENVFLIDLGRGTVIEVSPSRLCLERNFAEMSRQ